MMNTIDKFGSGGFKQRTIIPAQSIPSTASSITMEVVTEAASVAAASAASSKVSKSGDTMTGDLNILFSENNARTFVVSDISAGKSVSLLLGNNDNQIKHEFNSPLKIISANGTVIANGTENTCLFGADNTTLFKGDVSLDSHKLTHLGNPVSDYDASNKIYVDNKVNLIRELNNDISMQNYSILNLKSPINDHDAANKRYVDATAAAAAAATTAAMTSAAEPVNDNDLTRKAYVDKISTAIRSTESAVLELRASVGAAAAAAAAPRYIKSNCGFVPAVATIGGVLSKTGFTISSSSFTVDSVTNIFLPYVNNKSWIPSVDSAVGAECWVKVSCPFSVRLHRFQISGIHTEGAKKRHILTLTGSNGVKDSHNNEIEYTIFTTSEAMINNTVSSFDIQQNEPYSSYKLKLYSSEILRPGLSYMQLFSLDP